MVTTVPIISIWPPTACHDSTAVGGPIELQTTASGVETCSS